MSPYLTFENDFPGNSHETITNFSTSTACPPEQVYPLIARLSNQIQNDYQVNSDSFSHQIGCVERSSRHPWGGWGNCRVCSYGRAIWLRAIRHISRWTIASTRFCKCPVWHHYWPWAIEEYPFWIITLDVGRGAAVEDRSPTHILLHTTSTNMLPSGIPAKDFHRISRACNFQRYGYQISN